MGGAEKRLNHDKPSFQLTGEEVSLKRSRLADVRVHASRSGASTRPQENAWPEIFTNFPGPALRMRTPLAVHTKPLRRRLALIPSADAFPKGK